MERTAGARPGRVAVWTVVNGLLLTAELLTLGAEPSFSSAVYPG